LQQDQEEEEIFHLSETIEEADVVLNNDQTLAQLHRQIDRRLVPGLLEDAN
jgi:dephospho-CoA kinase